MTASPEGPGVDVDRDVLADRFRGALLGVALGDALGAGFEGSFSVPVDEFTRRASGRLTYTDDTHMTIGVAESLVDQGGFDGAAMASRFAADYTAESWRGYGPGPPQVFALLGRGVHWNEAAGRLFGGSGSFGNGAAMRAAPAGLFGFPDPDRAGEIARAQAAITHAHPLGTEGAALQATAVCLVLGTPRGGPMDTGRLLDDLRNHLREPVYLDKLDTIEALLGGQRGRQEVVEELGNGIEAPRSVPTALYCFLRHPDSFEEAVRFAVGLGGDTDTIASMAGALTGAWVGERGIPGGWRDRVEGSTRLRDLGDALLEAGLARTPSPL